MEEKKGRGGRGRVRVWVRELSNFFCVILFLNNIYNNGKALNETLFVVVVIFYKCLRFLMKEKRGAHLHQSS
jgi:hypothetical protein